jgi:glycine cleavage system H lipoate-binding protein
VRNVTTLMTFLDGLWTLVVGLALRLALLVPLLLALLAPVVLVVGAVKLGARLRRRALGLSELAGLPWRSGLLHDPGHLWARREREGLKLGLDALAQRLLHGVKRVALPVPGAKLLRGEPIAEIVTAERRVPIPAPLPGTVTRVNNALRDHPERLDQDPYVGGWLVTLEPEADAQGRFLQGRPADEWFAGESARLSRHLEHELGLAAADGGEPLLPPARQLTEDQWRKLADEFLRAA